MVVGSSRYAIEPLSRTTTPKRLGLTTGVAAITPLEGASVRVGLNRLRLATTLYALAGERAVSIAAADAVGAAARRPPTGSDVGATN